MRSWFESAVSSLDGWIVSRSRRRKRGHDRRFVSLSLCGLGFPALALAAAGNVAASAGQVQAGEALYQEACAGCHGASLKGDTGPALLPLNRIAALPGKTVTAVELAKWIRLNMPVSDPGSLSESQSYQLVAYMLASNGKAPPDMLAAGNAAAIPIRGTGK